MLCENLSDKIVRLTESQLSLFLVLKLSRPGHFKTSTKTVSCDLEINTKISDH